MVLLGTHNLIWLGNKKNNFQLHTLIWGPDQRKYIFIGPVKQNFLA